ncbi:MAG: hypothetical protein N3E45_13120 [Oscillatoriaceae bacterium SKW80]|nr:hypothetical protein [Oscillatoriaceae bacterium SKYG93]MCX8121742.1 hypothetical protein [Oscillatoriaceae bacterium SKW80]MDW8453642.1 hypothetical protein [Oscillatoriaceae cyanobacterium SKYGB_i_bin93]HIK28707.1 hypothetical protein [Oscillatoriaceae cyanobacterium M7585_C2015_266]
MNQSSVQLDPLNSPHPIPWNWILATHAAVSSTDGSGIRYYRTPSLLSPDGCYAAYSRIQMQVQPQFFRCRVTSAMFVENRQTGAQQTITASSPLANPHLLSSQALDTTGWMAILIPVSWSQSGERLLAREFEALLCTSVASDYAVIWDRHQNRATTIAPTQVEYTTAILLGWSQFYRARVLFRAGTIGEKDWKLWAVDVSGDTIPAFGDRPEIFGSPYSNLWTGPQTFG